MGQPVNAPSMVMVNEDCDIEKTQKGEGYIGEQSNARKIWYGLQNGSKYSPLFVSHMPTFSSKEVDLHLF